MAQFLGVWEARKERWVPKNDLSLLYFCIYHFKGLRGSHHRSAILMRGTITANLHKNDPPADISATVSKTFWKIESANAIFWMYLGGMAKKKFFLVIKLFCFSR